MLGLALEQRIPGDPPVLFKDRRFVLTPQPALHPDPQFLDCHRIAMSFVVDQPVVHFRQLGGIRQRRRAEAG
jgi:hypothetical protein